MEFEWNEEKRGQVLRERGVDMVRAARIFEGFCAQKEDRREEYGEKRFVAIGLVEDECFVLVWTPRGNKRRLITAWKGGRDERQDYEDSHAGRNPRNGSPG
ncbi:BrnT family toxin [Aurantimonas sp. A3-2-R12]